MKSIELDVQYYHLTRKAGNIVLIRDCTTAIEVADTHENLDLSRNAVIDTEVNIGYTTSSSDLLAACSE
ncbi:MAG: hypothetical protein HOH77_05080 [Candidatus Latescibacteria bacterium]|jgi:hypothetical protein|nr:hypothetical protein [Candidatus Latescibacterota bacterium]